MGKLPFYICRQAPGDAALTRCRVLRPQAVILLLALATPLLAEGAETFCSSGAANECTASLVSKLPSRCDKELAI